MILHQILAWVIEQTSQSVDSTFFGMNKDIASAWIELFSTIFFAATVGVLVWETILQKKELEVDEYSELRQHHHDLITLQIDQENAVTLEVFKEVKLPAEYRQYENDMTKSH